MALPRLNSPMGQVILVGAVCFCCPGMFSALSGMGGGGQVDSHAADSALTALYAAFALFGLLGGGFNNLLGPRAIVFFGSVFYALYAGSFLNYNHTKNEWPVIVAGGLLGVGAGLLWAGQGAILMSYPPEHDRGLYISIFWSVFNLGGVVGGLIPFVLNYNGVPSSGSVTDSTYIAFMVVMLLGSVLSLGLVAPEEVVRDDGTSVVVTSDSRRSSDLVTSDSRSMATEEAWQILKLFSEPKMLLLVPACIASNFFYTYQFNNVNGLLFNVRTRGLNNVVYWAAQMLGSLVAGQVLDRSSPRRKFRGMFGISLVAFTSTVVWGAGLANQLKYSRHDLPEVKLDFTDGGRFLWPFALYSCYGLLDAMYQTLCYWIMGETSSEMQTLSRYSGFYKGLQSAGAAVAWQLDAREMPLMGQFWINWILMTLSFPLLGIIVKDFKDQNHHVIEEEDALLEGNSQEEHDM